jgi:hypothetical protein
MIANAFNAIALLSLRHEKDFRDHGFEQLRSG